MHRLIKLFFAKAQRIIQKPMRVIIFRLYQWMMLALFRRVKGWRAVEWRSHRISLQKQLTKNTVILRDASPTLSSEEKALLSFLSENVIRSDFSIFSTKVPDLTSYDYQSDWRYGKKWPPQYYKSYVFYEQKNRPYDVKFPWELSRLHFLMPLFVNAAGNSDKYLEGLEYAQVMLARWRSLNRVAYSVNWYPMEASIRLINLVLMRDLVVQALSTESDAGSVLEDLYSSLSAMIYEHAVFVWMNREFTDVRGNHFTANLVALLCASYALSKNATSRKWRRYAIKWLNIEVSLQFLQDGVNFEKSCGYHKLVLELFILAAISRAKHGEPFAQDALVLLELAAKYSEATMRPDGSSAGFGDSDDAVILPFLFDRPRDHGPIVALSQSFLEYDSPSPLVKKIDYLAAKFLTASKGIPRIKLVNDSEVMYFPTGGYVVVRSIQKNSHLMIDVGEVGMNGRGGHGHNDLLSFEFMRDAISLVRDPGCSGYTADLLKKDHYRRTRSHSTVCLFDEEMARFSGSWGIENDAQPYNISVVRKDGSVEVCASHNGYERVSQGASVSRKFEINLITLDFLLTDEIDFCNASGSIEWNFPVGALEVNVSSDRRSAVIKAQGKTYSIEMKGEAQVCVRPDIYSEAYGHESPGNVLVARINRATGIVRQVFDFKKII
ncbi:alginate lyase family protein [Pigmentiphaga sp. YJ18]|uniref:alginate lyase family protein n=1 Tax=Pigmentiphaga sp. YJ18 TaxID=3134907 RepID=UPI003114B7D6